MKLNQIQVVSFRKAVWNVGFSFFLEYQTCVYKYAHLVSGLGCIFIFSTCKYLMGLMITWAAALDSDTKKTIYEFLG